MDRSEIRSRIFGHANISRICINCVKSDRFRSATEQLISGGSRLFANANQLVSGTNQLVSGNNQLITGTNQLISGTNQLIRRFDQLWHGIVGWLGSVAVLLPVVVGGLGSRGAGVPDPRGGAHGAGPTTSGRTSSGYTRPGSSWSRQPRDAAAWPRYTAAAGRPRNAAVLAHWVRFGKGSCWGLDLWRGNCSGGAKVRARHTTRTL